MMARTERLESLGVLAGGIAHDFNNLLAGVFGYLDLARESLRVRDLKEVEQSLSDALSVFGRARALTQQLLTFAKGGAPLRKTQPVDELVRKAVVFATSGSNCEVSFTSSPETWLCDVDEHQIGQGDRQSHHQCQAGHAVGRASRCAHGERARRGNAQAFAGARPCSHFRTRHWERHSARTSAADLRSLFHRPNPRAAAWAWPLSTPSCASTRACRSRVRSGRGLGLSPLAASGTRSEPDHELVRR